MASRDFFGTIFHFADISLMSFSLVEQWPFSFSKLVANFYTLPSSFDES